MRGSQPRSTTQQQPPQRPNLHTTLSDSLEKNDESMYSWRSKYSLIDQTRPVSHYLTDLKKKLETSQADLNTKRDLKTLCGNFKS